MKIGILTLPLHSNYGGVLQAYALYTTLQRMGHIVTLIDDKVYSIDTLKEKLSLLRWNVFRIVGLRTGLHPQLSTKEEMANILPFIYRYLPNQISMTHINEQTFDAIIVGSDQVWRGLYSTDLMRYFLNFTKGWKIRRWAYAASFGIDNWTQSPEVLLECSLLLRDFDYVSIREKSGADICCNLLNRTDTDWVIDPTMLLLPDDYLSLCTEIPACSENKLFCYILDENEDTRQIINIISNMQKKGTYTIDKKHKVSIESWLKSIAKSDYVFTDSFHGTVFSILLNKPFIVYGNVKRGLSRFESLLSTTGLMERFCSNVKQIDVILNKQIDWVEVNKRVCQQRTRCKKIISTLLES